MKPVAVGGAVKVYSGRLLKCFRARKQSANIKSELLALESIKITIFWDTTRCSWVGRLLTFPENLLSSSARYA